MPNPKAIEAIDLWKIKRPSSLSLSHDGSLACAAVTSYDMESNTGSTHLWLLSTFGGAPRQLTACGEKDGGCRWSPDGASIAFVAKRGEGAVVDKEPQVYIISPDGGEAKRVSNIATGVSGIKWFPDSKRVALISWVWPDLKNEKDQAKRLEEMQGNKCKAMVVSRTVYRYWDHWLTDGRVPRVHVLDVASGKTRDLFAGTAYELPVFDPDASDYDISPDGKYLVFTFNPNQDKQGDQETHLVEIEIKTGLAKNLTRSHSPALLPSTKRSHAPLNPSFTHHHPAYSVDGKLIALLVNNIRRSINDDNKLAVIDRKSNQLKLVSQRWDRVVNAPLKWAPDSQSIFFTADDHSRLSVWQMRLDDDEPALVAPGGTISDFDVKADSLVFVRSNMSAAPKVFAATATGEHAKPVESFNDALMAQFKMGEVREFTIKGWNGEAVQMWACYPPNFDPKKKWPLVHSIHGGPHANWGDNFHFRWNNQVFAAQGYVVVCVNYHGSLGWGNKYLESNMGVLGTKEHADIEAATDFMLRQGYIDTNRLAATGGSYGGMMVAWMNGRNGQPGASKKGTRSEAAGDRYKAYVCHAGCYDWVNQYSEDVGGYFNYELKAKYWENPEKVAAQNPITFARFMKTPTLVIHGALDYRVPDAQGLLYYNTLKSLNVESKLVFFPDENHWIVKPQNSRLWYREYFAWLEKFVGSGTQGRKGSGGARGIKPSSKKVN